MQIIERKNNNNRSTTAHTNFHNISPAFLFTNIYGANEPDWLIEYVRFYFENTFFLTKMTHIFIALRFHLKLMCARQMSSTHFWMFWMFVEGLYDAANGMCLYHSMYFSQMPAASQNLRKKIFFQFIFLTYLLEFLVFSPNPTLKLVEVMLFYFIF